MAASIITSVKGDVTYDGISDTVSLIGVQFGDSNAWQQMSLVIQNGATGQITAIALPEDAAYAPSILLVSLTSKDKRDILLENAKQLRDRQLIRKSCLAAGNMLC